MTTAMPCILWHIQFCVWSSNSFAVRWSDFGFHDLNLSVPSFSIYEWAVFLTCYIWCTFPGMMRTSVYTNLFSQYLEVVCFFFALRHSIFCRICFTEYFSRHKHTYKIQINKSAPAREHTRAHTHTQHAHAHTHMTDCFCAFLFLSPTFHVEKWSIYAFLTAIFDSFCT